MPPVDAQPESELAYLRRVARKCWSNWILYAQMGYPPTRAPGAIMALKYAEDHPWLLDKEEEPDAER